MALTSQIPTSTSLQEFLANHITLELKHLTGTTPQGEKDGKGHTRFQHRQWMFQSPDNLTDTKTVNGRTYRRCTKCNKGNSQWVQTHITETHIDDYRPKPCLTDANHPGGSLKPSPTTGGNKDTKEKQHKVSLLTNGKPAETPTAKSSLANGITNSFCFDVQELVDSD